MPIPREQIDPDAQKIIKRLVRYEHQAYLVGGCVRDLLLGRTPKDFDIATSATPPEIKELFRNCRIIGRRFRLAHIFFGTKIIETSTFRANPREVEPLDDVVLNEEGEEEGAVIEPDLLIRRDNVFGNAEEDARRRDFTINGLFYDLEAEEVIDYVGGLDDLRAGMVRTIGDPDIRFREDPVRILRAIKFAARLDFQIEPAAYQAILTHKGEIPKCAPPRVLEEIYRLLRGGAARRSIELLRDTGVLELLIPQLARRLASDQAGADRLWRTLVRIDEQGLRAPTNAVLLCALIGSFLGPELFEDADSRNDVGELLDAEARPVMLEMRVSRRDGERARQILLALRRMVPGKRRRGRPMSLVRRDYFDEVLEVFDLLGGLVLEPAVVGEEVTRWRRLQDGGRDVPDRPAGNGAIAAASTAAVASTTPGAASTTDDGAEPRRRRRRRRGGRKRRGGETPPDSSNTPTDPSEASGGSTPGGDTPPTAAGGSGGLAASSG